MARTGKAVSSPASLMGQVRPPGDKSISHRALIFNAIARGRASVSGLSDGRDVLSTLRCLRALGARIEPDRKQGRGAYVITGKGLGGLREPEGVLDAGNSGTTMRLLTGLLAAQPFFSVLNGDGSLRSRPMGRVAEPLRRMGAQIGGRKGGTLAPLAIRGGALHGIEYDLPVASAQVKSAIALAALYAQDKTVIRQPALSRDHTERMFRAMGNPTREEGLALTVSPGELKAVDVRVPGDFSGAVFWLVAAVCHPNARVRVCGVGMNPGRTGALDVLLAMGARIAVVDAREEGGEPVADLVAESSELRATQIRGDIVPRLIDEVPALAVAACFARGATVVADAQELRVKESDRIAAVVTEMGKLGAKLEERQDGMLIHGGAPLAGAEVASHGDHRLAMSLAVAGLLARGETVIEDAEAASISYPSFWRDLEHLAAGADRP